MRLFNVGCEKLLKAGFTQQLLHGGDAEELLFIGVKACALNGCGDCGFAGVFTVGAPLDQFPSGERRAADCLPESVFLHIRCPGGKRINLVQDAGDLLIGQEGRLLKVVSGKREIRFGSFPAFGLCLAEPAPFAAVEIAAALVCQLRLIDQVVLCPFEKLVLFHDADADTLGSQVQQINQLTVIASDGYKDFVADLQKGIRDDLYERPTKATAEYFIGKTLIIGGNDVTVSDKQGRDIYRYLIKNDYIDEDDHVTDKYRADLANGVLAPVPKSCTEISEGVHALIQSIFDEHALDNMISDGHETKIQENALNDNFYKKEFQTLWNYINHKYAYTVEFDSEELIRKAIAHIDDKMFVARLQYTVTTGEQGQDWNSDKLKSGAGFVAEKSQTYTLDRAEGSQVTYDLVGKIAEGAKLTRRTVARILEGIKPYTFAMFKNNPEEFITKAIRLINEQKATMIVEKITYNQTEGTYDSAIFTAEKNTDFSKAYRAKKNVQDYVFADGYAKDGQSVERKFAEDMDLAEEVCVYAKLPKGFSIPTPVGNYSPDWAIAFNKGTVKHIFFIAETKGTMETLNLKPIEKAKIDCARKLFAELSSADVVYDSVDSYQHLLDIMESL